LLDAAEAVVFCRRKRAYLTLEGLRGAKGEKGFTQISDPIFEYEEALKDILREIRFAESYFDSLLTTANEASKDASLFTEEPRRDLEFGTHASGQKRDWREENNENS
jgi:hypothetical protein